MRRPTMDGQRRRSDHEMAQLRRALTLEPTRQEWSACRSETKCPNLFLKILKQGSRHLAKNECKNEFPTLPEKIFRQHRTEARTPHENNSNVARELLGEGRRVKRPQQSTHCQANATP